MWWILYAIACLLLTFPLLFILFALKGNKIHNTWGGTILEWLLFILLIIFGWWMILILIFDKKK